MLAELGIEDLAIAAIAKGPDRNAGRERFFVPGREPFTLDPRSAVMYYLQRVRDEVHRFAIGTHRQKRAGSMKKSQLDEVPGIGPSPQEGAARPFRLGAGGGGRGAGGPGGGGTGSTRPSRAEFTIISTQMGSSGAISRANPRTNDMISSIPNLLTLSRILVIPALIGSFFLDEPLANWLALGLSSRRGSPISSTATWRRAMGVQSKLGQFLDPVADKLLVASALFMLAAKGPLTGVHLIAGVVILCREMLVSGLREVLAEIKVGLPVSRLAKWKTTVQIVAIAFLRARRGQPRPCRRGGHRAAVDRRRPHPLHRYDYLRAGLRHLTGPREPEVLYFAWLREASALARKTCRRPPASPPSPR